MIVHYRNFHEAQIKRNEHFVNERRLLISVTVVIVSTYFYVFPKLQLTLDYKLLPFYFNLLFVVGCFLCINVIDKLFKASSVRDLRDISPPNEWREYEKYLKLKYAKNKSINVDAFFESALSDAYCEAATVNQSANDKIGELFKKAIKSLFLCFLMLIPSLADTLIFPPTQSKEINKETICETSKLKNREPSQGLRQQETLQIDAQ
ncbi:hypothetical protein [Vibrio cholerae]|uniref:hypothetical protein n=1 Tax=Vibrio cholerae TaxID=666 RepID=UPI003966BBC8